MPKSKPLPAAKDQCRCPRLGGWVPFDYCMHHAQSEGPCFKTIDCWWERFDVIEYLRAKLSPEDLQRLIKSKPPQKVSSLIELIQQAQTRVDRK